MTSRTAAARGAAARDDDPLLIVYTSGTTGKPKGAVLTHANCFWTNLGFDLATGVSGEDVVLQVLPQFHCGGWNVQPLLAWWKGARVVLERSFDAARCLALIAEKRVTTMMGVPAIYLFMAQEPGFGEADLTSLRRAVVGGAPMPESLLETWRARGVAIVQGYGLTEAAPNVLCLPPEDAIRKLGYAGKPYPYVEVALRDPDNGESPRGTSRGRAGGSRPERLPRVLASPRRPSRRSRTAGCEPATSPSATTRASTGSRRRLKDMFISGGENVYPAEVEGVLHAHQAVAEAAVVGIPDDRWGEVGIAAVVVAPGASAGEDELIAHCRARLAGYKVPKAIRFVDELPRGALGKVLKDDLRGLAGAGGGAVTAVPTSVDGRPLSPRGARTRRRLLEAAEQMFAELGLPRRLDREAHRGGRRGPGHLLPLLHEQEADLR